MANLLSRLRGGDTPTNRSSGSFNDWAQWFSFNGHLHPHGFSFTQSTENAEPIAAEFGPLAQGAFKSSTVVAACEYVRLDVFSEARFLWQKMNGGRPGDLSSTAALDLLERPWPGATTGDLLTRMLLHADLAGNWFGINPAMFGGERQIVSLRPDWVEIVVGDRRLPVDEDQRPATVGSELAGYFYYEGGKGVTNRPAFFLPNEVAHFAPRPDPMATFRGMSWMTPVIREIQADIQATRHKLKFYENAATPNLAVSLPKEMSLTAEQFEAFIEKMDASHRGVNNAYKTLYTGNGADVTVIGADMKQLDFKATQGAGETRIAAASGVGAVVAQLSEGMQGSSLNAGNYSAARRRVADAVFRPLWRNAAGSLEVLLARRGNRRLWYDDSNIAFLREDAKDAAEIEAIKASTINSYVREGFTAESAKAAVDAQDVNLLKHTDLLSVQLQPAGVTPPAPAEPPTTEE